ncbi:MAG: hypothetical protein AAF657_09895 [Acidobacteriota bacterium]
MPPNPGLRVAVSSSGSDRAPWWAWAATLGGIVGAGLALYAVRSSLAPTLDRWLPSMRQPVAEIEPPTEPEPVTAPEPAAEEPTGPEWTFADVEAALEPLPESAQVLIAEGREELQQFKGLDSTNESVSLPARNRWRLWGRIWRNRVEQIRTHLPPLDTCGSFAELQPTCEALNASLETLSQLPTVRGLEDARAQFAAAEWVLDTYQGPPYRPGRRSRRS